MSKTTLCHIIFKADMGNLKYGRRFIMNSAMSRHTVVLLGRNTTSYAKRKRRV